MRDASGRGTVISFLISYFFSAFAFELALFVMTVRVYDIAGSAWDVGLFMAVTFSAKLASPFLGVLADRLHRGRLFAAAAGICGSLTVMTALSDGILSIYFLWFLLTMAMMLILIVRTALMTEVMPQERFVRGNSRVMFLLNASRIAAPLAGGMLAALLPARLVLEIAAAFYFLSVVFSAPLKSATSPAAGGKGLSDAAASMREGISYLFTDPKVRHLTALAMSWRVFVGMQASVFVVYVKGHLGAGDPAYGAFLASIGFGSMVGAMLGPRLARWKKPDVIVFRGLVLHYLTFALLGAINNFAASLVVAFVSWMIFIAAIVSVHSLRDWGTPQSLRGRVYGSMISLTSPMAMISLLAGGYLSSIYGVQNVMACAGLLAAISTVVILSLRARFEKHPLPAIAAESEG